tara:strand:+ start:5161 stop:6345 length:1185 start_codon:yes stop_codon:yes gene_type:complete
MDTTEKCDMGDSDNEEYDSDTEYVPDYDMVDLSNWVLTQGEALPGGSWEFIVAHVNDEDASLQFACPHFKIEDKLDMQQASKNGFFRVNLDPSDTKHLEFQSWIMKVETWLVSQIVNNYDNWFGHLYEKGAVWEGHPKPPASVIQSMYHPMIDEEGIFCPRVHIKKGQFECQSMDIEYNQVDLNTINNCEIVPLVELKGVFMKPHGYNPDLVLRGIVKVLPTEDEEEKKEFALFHTSEDEKQYHYYDYATDDGETDDDDDDDDDEDDENTAEAAAETEGDVPPTPIEVAEEKDPSGRPRGEETRHVPAMRVVENEDTTVKTKEAQQQETQPVTQQETQQQETQQQETQQQETQQQETPIKYDETELARLLEAQERAQQELEAYKNRSKLSAPSA